MGIYFRLWVLIQYYFIYFDAKQQLSLLCTTVQTTVGQGAWVRCKRFNYTKLATLFFFSGTVGRKEVSPNTWMRGMWVNDPRLTTSLPCLGLSSISSCVRGLPRASYSRKRCFPKEDDPTDPSLKAEVSKCFQNSRLSWLLVAVGPCSRRLLCSKPRSKKGLIHQHPCPFTLPFGLPT